ncbi:MAG: DUF6142 family protein [Butyrivibrio sp.]
MAKHKYKFSTKKHSIGGVISTVMFPCSLALFIWAVVVSFQSKGKGGSVVGEIALTSFAVALFGCIIGMLSYKESDRYYTFSFIGSLLNGIMTILMFMLFVAGL